MKASLYEPPEERAELGPAYSEPESMSAPIREMGLAPSGLMRQEIYEDEYGFDAWDTSVKSRCFVHVVNSLQFFQVTGIELPRRHPTAKDYTDAGLPCLSTTAET